MKGNNEEFTNSKNNKEHTDQFFNDAYKSSYDVISKNNRHFEIKTTYLSSGLILFSLIFIFGRFTHNQSLLILGLIFAVLTLIINMYSYVYGNTLMKNNAEKFLKLRDETQIDLNQRRQIVRQIALRTNGKLTCINNVTIYLLILGMFFFLIFIISNAM